MRGWGRHDRRRGTRGGGNGWGRFAGVDVDVEACGSPGEVANEPSLGWTYTMLMSSLYEASEQGEVTDQYYSRTNGEQQANPLSAHDTRRSR